MRSATVLLALVLCLGCRPQADPRAERPNIVWITSEDNGPHLGAYGDPFADTPNLDALAARGMIFTNAWSNAPVCAPARTAIISGVYPPSLGAQHMRSMVRMPQEMKMYPQYLREAGYYATNNAKEDYNLVKPGQVWDASSREAHWRNRANDQQPFFAIFNFTTTHESQIRSRPHEAVHDPDQVRVPGYHPDAPEVRQDWAQYYDKMTEMDAQAGEVLRQLEEDGLTESTIVFYYGDHGPGMPRSKRWTYNSGLQVPLIVYIPERFLDLAGESWNAGETSSRPVSFVDLAPTVLSLAGIEPPAFMQGEAFLGRYAETARDYNYGFRGRMDERYDMVRAVRDDRFIYIRNYNPHKIYGQYVAYMFQTPTTQVWKRLSDEGVLPPSQAAFWTAKPAEELYDLHADPDETNNLVGSPEHRDRLERLRRAEREWVLAIRDLGFLPEYEIHRRAGDDAPYAMGQDPARFPIERIVAAAELASAFDPQDVPSLLALLDDGDPAVRYWGVLGLLIRGPSAVAASSDALEEALQDPAPVVRIAAAEALGRFGSDPQADRALDVLMGYADPQENGIFLAMQAMNAVDYMDERAAGAAAAIARLAEQDPNVDERLRNYVARLKEKTLADLQ